MPVFMSIEDRRGHYHSWGMNIEISGLSKKCGFVWGLLAPVVGIKVCFISLAQNSVAQ